MTKKFEAVFRPVESGLNHKISIRSYTYQLKMWECARENHKSSWSSTHACSVPGVLSEMTQPLREKYNTISFIHSFPYGDLVC